MSLHRTDTIPTAASDLRPGDVIDHSEIGKWVVLYAATRDVEAPALAPTGVVHRMHLASPDSPSLCPSEATEYTQWVPDTDITTRPANTLNVWPQAVTIADHPQLTRMAQLAEMLERSRDLEAERSTLAAQIDAELYRLHEDDRVPVPTLAAWMGVARPRVYERIKRADLSA